MDKARDSSPRSGGVRDLLWVGVVLAVLAAMILPSLLIARERMRNAACQRQLLQMARALKMYTDEHSGFFPPQESWGAAVTQRAHVLRFACPDTPDLGGGWRPGFLTTGYAYNGALAGYPYDPRRQAAPVPLNLAAVRYPASTVAACDCRIQIPAILAPDVNLKGAPAWGEEGGRRHDGGANYAFVDGHVRWLRPEQVEVGLPRKNQSRQLPTFWP